MRKLLAYLLCIFITFTLGYSLLHPTFRAIADWLSPVVGPSILTLLISAYLLFGDPLRFRVLLLVWALTGILCGVIIRRRMGGVSTAVGIYSTVSIFMGLSLYHLVWRVQEFGIVGMGKGPFEAIPPLPKGLTIAHLVEAPIMSVLIKRFTTFIGMVSLSPSVEAMTESLRELLMTLPTQLLTPILISSTENIVIVAVATLIGVEVGRLLEKTVSPWSESIRNRLRRGGVAALLLFLIVSLASPSVQAQGEGVYMENLIGVADDVGKSYLAALFLDTDFSIGGINLQSPETEGLVASILLTHEGILNLLLDVMGEMGIEMDGFDPSLINLILSTFLITIYLDTPHEAAEDRSSAIASSFSQHLEVEFHRLLSLERELNTTEGPSLIYFSLHISSADVGRVSEKCLSLIPSEREGLAEAVVDAYRDGKLSPDGSADGVLLFAGIINPRTLLQYIPVEGMKMLNLMDLFLPRIDEGIGISGLLSYWRRGVHSAEALHTLDLTEILGVEGLSFSSDADVSNLLILVLNATKGEPIYGRLMTTLSLESSPPGMELEVLSRGSFLTSSQLAASFEAAIPPYIEVVKTVSPAVVNPGDEMSVTITMENKGEEAIYNVSVHDSTTVIHYPLSAEISGSTEGSWPSIEPGGSRSITYKLNLLTGGVYTLSPALVEYEWRGEAYMVTSESVEVRVRQPPPLSIIIGMFTCVWIDAARLLDIFTDGKGIQVMQLLTAAIIVLLAIQEMRNLRKWLKEE